MSFLLLRVTSSILLKVVHHHCGVVPELYQQRSLSDQTFSLRALTLPCPTQASSVLLKCASDCFRPELRSRSSLRQPHRGRRETRDPGNRGLEAPRQRTEDLNQVGAQAGSSPPPFSFPGGNIQACSLVSVREGEQGESEGRRVVRYPDSQQLFVGNVPHDVDKNELKEFFESMSDDPAASLQM